MPPELSGISQAHELRPAVAEVLVTKSQIKIKLSTTVETLLAGIDLSQVTDTDEAPEVKVYDQLRSLSDFDLAQLVKREWTNLERALAAKNN